jgi:hypothetical protein
LHSLKPLDSGEVMRSSGSDNVITLLNWRQTGYWPRSKGINVTCFATIAICHWLVPGMLHDAEKQLQSCY